MSNGANSQNEVASNGDATGSGGGSSSPVPQTPAPTADVIHVDTGKKAAQVILPAPVHNSLTGDVYELPAETVKAQWMVFRYRPVFRGKARVKPC